MARTKYLAAGVLLVSTTVAVWSYVTAGEPPTRPPSDGPVARSGTLGGGVVAGVSQAPGRPELAELDRLIEEFSRQTREAPSAAGLSFLGQLELQRARLTGDVTSYARAERSLVEAVELAPSVVETQAVLASVRFTMHDFIGAYALADRVYDETGALAALAVRGDAALELGRYDEATADYRALEGSAPSSASTLVRLSRLTFVRGDAAEAARLAAAAERAAGREGAFGASRSWYAAYRGRLALDAGRYGEAARHCRRAVEAAHDYHVAVAGLASVRAAQGRIDDAIRLYERAATMVPEPTTLAALGDLYALSGDRRAADDRYATVEAIATLQAVSRRLYDRQLALFWADHDGDLEDALGIAERNLERRRDVYGYDVLAWVLYRMGRFEDARAASDRALAMDTPDARLWFHAGMISAALGESERARQELSHALALHPAFDPLLAPVARAALEDLGGAA
jgi:tetratricopeptide (TPR) repeat protein